MNGLEQAIIADLDELLDGTLTQAMDPEFWDHLNPVEYGYESFEEMMETVNSIIGSVFLCVRE